MLSKSIMVQGTASTVGKSFINTAFCRIFTQDGYEVNPFKSQNMSLNSYITLTGGEMGRAQVVQAEACRKLPDVLMNPVLLKPSSDRKSQIILNGKVHAVMDAMDYYEYKINMAEDIKSSYQKLLKKSDIVVLEGAGSPAEINLKKNDIVNMGMAEMARSPVVLVGDIDKGGVFASLLGTLMLLTEKERSKVKGLLINKFRGDEALLKPGLLEIEKLTGIPVLGVIPMADIDIEEEDSAVDFSNSSKNKKASIEIGVIKLPYLSNFTDIKALSLEPDVNIRLIETIEDFGQPDLIILPGSKSTVTALQFLKERGLFEKIQIAREKGAFVFGICGGYQLLGEEILDPLGVESKLKSAKALGLLCVKTVFSNEKTTQLSKGKETLFHIEVEGYEIHMGSEIEKKSSHLIRLGEQGEGAVSEDWHVIGTYLHGIFDNSSFTRSYLNFIRETMGREKYSGELVQFKQYKQNQYDRLADHVRNHVDMEKIYEIVKEGL